MIRKFIIEDLRILCEKHVFRLYISNLNLYFIKALNSFSFLHFYRYSLPSVERTDNNWNNAKETLNYHLK